MGFVNAVIALLRGSVPRSIPSLDWTAQHGLAR